MIRGSNEVSATLLQLDPKQFIHGRSFAEQRVELSEERKVRLKISQVALDPPVEMGIGALNQRRIELVPLKKPVANGRWNVADQWPRRRLINAPVHQVAQRPAEIAAQHEQRFVESVSESHHEALIEVLRCTLEILIGRKPTVPQCRVGRDRIQSGVAAEHAVM